jgi:FKBP-type peptidyl-prolyl cis-trans isomerase FkpA
MRTMKTIRAMALPALALTALLACSGTPFQVIEEAQFAPELGIDLSQMTKLENGVYIEDREIGTGPAIVYNAEITLSVIGWLSDGTEFQNQIVGPYTLLEGAGAIPGLNLALLGLQEGGTRLMVIPPGQAYGDEDRTSPQGVRIPAGSILVFEITADVVTPPV